MQTPLKSKRIEGLVRIPLQFEPVPFAAALATVIIKLEGISENDPSSVRLKEHERLSNDLCVASGHCFTLNGITDDPGIYDPDRVIGGIAGYAGNAIEYAGYSYNEYGRERKRFELFDIIKASADADRPLLIEYGFGARWAVVAGYDASSSLYCMQNDAPYPGRDLRPTAKGFLKFVKWYENLKRIVVLGEKKLPRGDITRYYKNGAEIMAKMRDAGFLSEAARFILDDYNFIGVGTKELLRLRNSIDRFFDAFACMRYSLALSLEARPERYDESSSDYQYYKGFERIGFVKDICDLLWIPWRASGAFMGGTPSEWANGLKNKTVRRMMADILGIVEEKEEILISCLNPDNEPARGL